MNYSELIKRKKEYKYSANLCFDLKNANRLSGFIPNKTTTEILAEYLYGIINNTSVHSRILYGSYGTGKSHLLTVLCAILGHINCKSDDFKVFLEAIEKYDSELVEFLKKFISKRKPYFVVPVYSDYSDFDKCISFSLKKELERNGYSVVFKNYFQEAKELLKKWEKGKESKARLGEILKELKVDIKELYSGLDTYNSDIENVFDNVFKKMTFGASFVSEAGNMQDNLEAANEAISKDYEGIVFVFDEFGRYIEDEGENVRVKSIQDLAEYCDHSNYNDYLVLVSHKQLSLYTDRMSKEKSNEWKKVEGRFKATSINIKYDQCLSLISHIIPKTKAWKKYEIVFKDELNELFSKAYDFKGFMLPPEGEKPFEGGFPLHPITLFSLDRLSKRVAQNERTFFTFLASEEENALFWILDKLDTQKFHFVGLDAIFDYFEPNIRAFRSDEVYEVYKKYQYALNKLGDCSRNSVEVRILKTMAVIGIISDTSVLAADRGMLNYVIDANINEIDKAIDNLEKSRIIKYMRQFGFYDFLDSSIFDFETMIDEKMDSVSLDMVVSELNEEFINFVIYPYEYNSKYHLNRIFIPVFALRQDVCKKSFTKILPTYYDGAVGMIVDEEFDENNYLEMENIPERLIMLVNSKPEEFINEVKRYIAIKFFYSKRKELSKEDPTAEKELTLYLDEQSEIIKDFIKNWRLLNNKSIIPFVNGRRQKVKSEKALSDLASSIMYESFSDTIIVNNDLVSKNNISGTMNSSRNKVLYNLINAKEDIMEGFSPMSPEHTIIRSVLIRNGMEVGHEDCNQNILPEGTHKGESSGKFVMHEIEKYLRKCEKAQRPVHEIYEILKKEPYGLRDGYISILLGYALRKYENVGLYFHGTEKDYDVDEFNKTLSSPEDYSFYLCNWSSEQRKYIADLEEIFKTYLNVGSKNRLKELYKAMNAHYSSISKIARSTDKYVSEKTKKYRDILSITHKDYYKFFFEDLLVIDSDLEKLVYTMQQVKLELENVIILQNKEVEKAIKTIAVINADSLIKGLKQIYDESWKAKSEKAFDYQTNMFLEALQAVEKYSLDSDCVAELAKIITGFELEYWTDSSIIEFEEVFKQIIDKLNDCEIKDELGNNEVQIVIKNGSEQDYITRFDKCEMSVNGQVMYNKIKSTLGNLGKGISQEEKLVIMAKLLTELK